MVAGLIAYLKHQQGNQVLEFFKKDAHLLAIDSFWDKKEQCTCSKDDDHVASLLINIDDDYILTPIKKGSTKSQPSNIPDQPLPNLPVFHSLQRNTFGEDDNSIGSFHHDQAWASTSVASDNSATMIAGLMSCLTAMENILCSNNIGIPTTSLPLPTR